MSGSFGLGVEVGGIVCFLGAGVGEGVGTKVGCGSAGLAIDGGWEVGVGVTVKL